MGSRGTPAAAPATPPAYAAGRLLAAFVLFSSLFISGEAYVVRWKNNTLTVPKYMLRFEPAEAFSLAAAKDASRFADASTAAPPPRLLDAYQPDFRGIKAAMQANNAEGLAALAKQHNRHQNVHHGISGHDESSPPDFERQLEELKTQRGELPVGGEDAPVAPLSRKDDLFTPGLGVEEVSVLRPRRPEGSGDLTTDQPPAPPADLLESEADVLEELRKLSGLQDDALAAEGGPVGTEEEEGGGEEDEGLEEAVVDGTTRVHPGEGGVASSSLEERLSASLRELAELRRLQQTSPAAPTTTTTGRPPMPPAHDASADRKDVTPATGDALPATANHEGGAAGGGEISRTAMKKAHMARKLMDPEDPKRDEDLLELMLRVAENPEEWQRVHHLLRQLDDDLTTYERTMGRVQALASERKASLGASAPPPRPTEEGREARREEMSRLGLPAGTHGEARSTTSAPTDTSTRHLPPPQQQSDGAHHKDWRPKFAYHRVTTAPLPDLFLQQQQNQQNQQHHEGEGQVTSVGGAHHHRNAYIAVSIIAPPGRGGGSKQPAPPPLTQSTRPTPAPTPTPAEEEDAEGEETLGAPVVGEDEEEVEAAARQASSLHRGPMVHSDPVEEQLRALAAVEERLRHHIREKERMQHLMVNMGKVELGHHSKDERSMVNTLGHHHHQDSDHVALKTS